MSWDRFHFICRRARQQLLLSKPLSLQDDADDLLAANYGAPCSDKSIASNLLKQLSLLADRSQLDRATNFYASGHFSQLGIEPQGLRRISVYLGYLLLMFIVMNMIYQQYVFPEFINYYSFTEEMFSAETAFYIQYWQYITALAATLIIAAFLLSLTARKLLRFDVDVSSSWVFRGLFPRSIKQAYLQMIAYLYYPLDAEKIDNSLRSTDEAMQAEGIDILDELPHMMSAKLVILLERVEKYMQLLYSITAIVIIYIIYNYISSVYSPLFKMGEAF